MEDWKMMKNALHFPHLFVWPSGKRKNQRKKQQKNKKGMRMKKTHKDCRRIFFYMNYDISSWSQLGREQEQEQKQEEEQDGKVKAVN